MGLPRQKKYISLNVLDNIFHYMCWIWFSQKKQMDTQVSTLCQVLREAKITQGKYIKKLQAGKGLLYFHQF